MAVRMSPTAATTGPKAINKFFGTKSDKMPAGATNNTKPNGAAAHISPNVPVADAAMSNWCTARTGMIGSSMAMLKFTANTPSKINQTLRLRSTTLRPIRSPSSPAPVLRSFINASFGSTQYKKTTCMTATTAMTTVSTQKTPPNPAISGEASHPPTVGPSNTPAAAPNVAIPSKDPSLPLASRVTADWPPTNTPLLPIPCTARAARAMPNSSPDTAYTAVLTTSTNIANSITGLQPTRSTALAVSGLVNTCTIALDENSNPIAASDTPNRSLYCGDSGTITVSNTASTNILKS
mmetsp:Transcript_62295/g.166950  ORF Transcript_62295/g.166950 Transcript_62295/m.166950 type:complete len:294 (+) Transcript_62295:488-1369(+)